MSATAMWPTGAAYIDGRFMPIAEAMIPVTEWGYRRSDVTYDVVSVWDGAFFKLDDHMKRFRNSMDYFRLQPRRATTTSAACCTNWCGARACARHMSRWTACAVPPHRICAGIRRMRATTCWRFAAVRLADAARGDRARRASDRRLDAAHSRGVRQSAREELPLGRHDEVLVRGAGKGADNPVLLDMDGNVTEGPGFNVFAVTDGMVATPDRGVLEGITRLSVIQMCEKLGIPARCARCRWKNCGMRTRCSSRPPRAG